MPEVSIFGKIKNIYNPINIDLLECLEFIRDGKWEDIVTECRLIKDKAERDDFKDRMERITFSGKFSRRNNDGLEEHSGIIYIDLDDVEDIIETKKRLSKDRYVLSVVMSVSGTGLGVMFKINPTKHRDSFFGISKYLKEEYGLIPDIQSQVLSKPIVVTFDPYIYINPDWDSTPVFKKYIKETVVKKISNFVHTATDFDEVLSQIIKRNVSICENYSDWLKVCFALSEQFGEGGREYFHNVSQFSKSYDKKICDKQFDYCLKSRGTGNPVNISTFYYLAKINNISIVSEQTKIIVRSTKNGKRAGLKKDQIVENLLKYNNISGADDIVDNVFTSSSDYMDEEESILDQLEIFISNNYNLLMNEVTGYLEQEGKMLTQNDLNTMFVSAKKMMPKLDYNLMVRLLTSDFIPSYNPFFKFFESDGIPVILPAIPIPNEIIYYSPTIDKLAESIENDNPAYTLFFLKKWIVSIISAAHKVHSPLLLCLLGGQNTGKTEFLRRLLPRELQLYYAESKLDQGKDDELLMTENIIIMDDELGGKSKQDNLKLKNLTSKQWFSLRRPYGAHNEKILRLAVLCGTSNTMQILSDSTGNRRIIPIEVKNINKDLYNSIDKKELFMEAFRLYKSGFDWRITMNDIKYLNIDDFKYEVVVVEHELIDRFYEPILDGEDRSNADWMTTSDIKVELEKLTNQKLGIIAIGVALEKLGFKKLSHRHGPYNAKTTKMWCLKKLSDLDRKSIIIDNLVGNFKYKKEDDEAPF